jgi:dihydrofolate reductase
MRNVVLYEMLSLDGVAEGPGEGEWFGGADHRLIDNLHKIISRQDTVLLGRRSYDSWSAHWPSSTLQPFADFINHTSKIVFSSTAPERQWNDTTHVATDAVPYVRALKDTEGGDIGVHGSLSLAHSLLSNDLIDELRLVVAPRIAGSGRRLFEPTGHLQKFTLISSDLSGECLLLHYRKYNVQG